MAIRLATRSTNRIKSNTAVSAMTTAAATGASTGAPVESPSEARECRKSAPSDPIATYTIGDPENRSSRRGAIDPAASVNTTSVSE